MSLTRSATLVLLAVAASAPAAAAQGSAFAVRGLGWSGRPVSARTAGTAGALAMFDPTMGANPAALSRWRSTAAWAVAAPTERSYESPFGNAELQTVRFPLIGFAAPLPSRATIGFSISDYLDRTFTVTVRDTMNVRGSDEPFTDAGRSIGGISDLSLAVGWRATGAISLGAGFHYYMGSTRLTVQRSFDNLTYDEIFQQSQTDFRGPGFSAGLLAALTRRLEISVSGRYNGTLLSSNSGGSTARTELPPQVAFGARWQPVPGVYLAGSALYDAWSGTSGLDTAGGVAALDVWSYSAGLEVLNFPLVFLRTPLRLGYRARRLPFTSLGEPVNEWGASAGIGFNLANDRATVDFSFEKGKRESGSSLENFNSLFVGLTVRP